MFFPVKYLKIADRLTPVARMETEGKSGFFAEVSPGVVRFMRKL